MDSDGRFEFNGNIADNELYSNLVGYIRYKFASRPDISAMSEDIVGDVFIDVYAKHGNDLSKLNFGYMSVACVRLAYKRFKAWDIRAANTSCYDDCLGFLSDSDVVDDIIRNEDARTVLDSLETLKAVEKEIILGRYYGDLKFSKIADDLGMNLNTVLSHHRRALEKLRPQLSRYFQN